MIGVPVLSIAGSDPSGGAGIQADLKSVAACGGYGMSVITALTAQNTRGVQDVHVPAVSFLARQLESVLTDIPPGGVKIGMLGSVAVIDTVAEALRPLRASASPVPVVLDPVMVSTSGHRLADQEAESALSRLLGLVDVVTPNAPELATLLGEEPATDPAALVRQGRLLARRHRVWVLAKGGHLEPTATPEGAGPDDAAREVTGRDVMGPARVVTDALISPEGEVDVYEHPYLLTRNTHGTGCSLSSALATFAARGADWRLAARLATDHVAGALAGADRLDLGEGHGPIDHLSALWGGAGAPSLGLASHWWESMGRRALAAQGTSVVRALACGRPDPALIRRYLEQDLAYLADYAEHLDALAEAAATAGDRSAAEFWAASALACRHEEPALHERLGATRPEPDDVTRAYAEHLAAARRQGPEVLAAAVLPCFVLYSEVGILLAERLGAGIEDADPEAREWITTYADPAFAATSRLAMDHLDRWAESADPARRRAMRAAMAESLEREIAFFER